MEKVTVNIDYHVEFDGRYYSVPYQLVRQPVEVRATATTVEVLKGESGWPATPGGTAGGAM